jgi:hypothetical protein
MEPVELIAESGRKVTCFLYNRPDESPAPAVSPGMESKP